MKRSYTYLKGLLTLALAAFTGWMWAAGESISIGVDNGWGGPAYSGDTLYGWTDAQVAGKNWNNYNNEASLSELKGNDGIVVSGASFEVTAKGGSWRHWGPSELGGGTRDYYDGQWNFSLKGIPFSQYSVVLFMATDNGGKQWGAVRVTASGAEKYYTYTNGTLSAEGAADSTWGSTSLGNNYTAEEGVNVMVIPNLSGNTTFLTYGTSGGAATRGGLYAIQIINTGDLIDSTTYEASSAATSVKFSELIWDKEFKPAAVDSAVLTLTATEAVTLEIDQNLALANLVVNAAGDVTITSSGELSLSTLDCRNVKGKLTIPASIASATGLVTATTEGASTYFTGETTVSGASFPYSGNRHFETIKFTVQQMGNGIEDYTIAANEQMLFTYTNVRYVENLILDGGLLKTQGNDQAWFGGAANKCLTVKSGIADLTSVTTDSSSNAVLIGFSGNGHTLDIQGGLLDASNTSIVGWEANSKYSQSGGLVKTKGFRQNGDRITEMTLTGGTIELGAGGIPNLEMASATLGAATIRATADATIAEALNVTGAATLQAVDGKMLTVSGTISGDGTIAIGGTGTTKTRADNGTYTDAMVNATGTVYIGTNRPKIASIAEGATLQIALTDDEVANGISWTVGENLTTEEANRLTVVGATLGNITITDGVLTASLASNLAASWENGVWSKTPVEGSPVSITFSEGHTTCTFTNTEAIELASLTIRGETAGEIVLGEYAVTVSEMTVEPAEVTIPVALFNSFDAQAYTVESGKTLKLKGDANVSKTMAVNGTLVIDGSMNFTADNYVYNGGKLEVASGVTMFNTGDGRGFQDGCTIKIAKGATLKNGKADASGYGNVTFDIAGTLEVTDGVRWSLGTTSSTTLREGAILKGTGENDDTHRYAFDYFAGTTISVDGDAKIEGNIGAHDGATINFNVTSGKTLTIEGAVKAGVLATSGAGTVKLAGANTHANTSIANGSKLVVTHASALGSGNITLDGTLTFKDVEAALSNQITQTDPNNTTNPTGQIVIDNSTVTLNGPNGNYKGVITVNTGAKLKSVTNNYAPFGNGASIVNNGAIDVTNTGTGDCAISAVISGSGSLTLNAGTLILGGANTYRGTTTIAAGAKVIAQTESGATWNFNNVSTEADVTVNGTLDFVSTSEIYRGFAGSAGTINIKGNVILGNTGNSDELSGLSRFKGNLVVDDEKTLTLITWENPYDIALASLELNGAIVGQAKGANASTLSLTTQALSGTGTINIPVTLADGATLAGAVTVNSTVTVAGALNITHADEAGETVITCNNAADILASLPPAPQGLKYVAEDSAVKLAKAGAFIVGGDVYETFADAFAAAIEGEVAEITIDENATEDVFETPGFKITKDVTIDLGGKTLRLTPPAVGSAGTETLGIQILNTAETVVIKNGKIDVVGSNLTAEKPIKMMINNYVSQSLTLQDVTLDGTNLVKPENMAAYTLSNNQGVVAILHSKIKAKAGGIAFDACKYASYEAPTVMVDEDSIIEGDVELSGGSVMAAEGAITVVSGLAGYKVVYNGTAYTLEKKGAFEVNGVDYATLAEAYAVGSEIKLIADAEAPAFKIEKALTLDLGGKMLTLTPQGVGSTGTETLGIQIKMATTIKNGTIAVAESNTSYTGPGKPIKMLINNYADLTLKNVTLNGTNLYKEEGKVNYTLSNNCGEVTIDAESAIIANDGGIAFDVCKFGSYDAPTVTVAEGATITGKVEITGGTLTDNTGALNVGTTADFILNKVGNVYTVTAIVIDDNIDKNGNISAETKAAIKAAMAQAGVAEISNYTITTKKTGASAEVAEVAAVLEVFDVTPEVAENGVLTVAYEFGISNINNNGDDTVDITAGVTGAEYRAGVTVVFYADGAEIDRATTTADSTTVSIEGISVDTIKGKKITVKAIK